jgi:hypothetical protein
MLPAHLQGAADRAHIHELQGLGQLLRHLPPTPTPPSAPTPLRYPQLSLHSTLPPLPPPSAPAPLARRLPAAPARAVSSCAGWWGLRRSSERYLPCGRLHVPAHLGNLRRQLLAVELRGRAHPPSSGEDHGTAKKYEHAGKSQSLLMIAWSLSDNGVAQSKSQSLLMMSSPAISPRTRSPPGIHPGGAPQRGSGGWEGRQRARGVTWACSSSGSAAAAAQRGSRSSCSSAVRTGATGGRCSRSTASSCRTRTRTLGVSRRPPKHTGAEHKHGGHRG